MFKLINSEQTHIYGVNHTHTNTQINRACSMCVTVIVYMFSGLTVSN